MFIKLYILLVSRSRRLSVVTPADAAAERTTDSKSVRCQRTAVRKNLVRHSRLADAHRVLTRREPYVRGTRTSGRTAGPSGWTRSSWEWVVSSPRGGVCAWSGYCCHQFRFRHRHRQRRGGSPCTIPDRNPAGRRFRRLRFCPSPVSLQT